MIHPVSTFCIKAIGTEDDLVEVMTNQSGVYAGPLTMKAFFIWTTEIARKLPSTSLWRSIKSMVWWSAAARWVGSSP